MPDPSSSFKFGQPAFSFGPGALFCGVSLRDQRTRVVEEGQDPVVSCALQLGVEPQPPPPEPPQEGRQSASVSPLRYLRPFLRYLRYVFSTGRFLCQFVRT